MHRLKQETENSPKYTDQQFKDIWTGKLGGVDEERFELLMSKYKKGKILDVGCFDSPLPIRYDAIGVDYAPEMIETLSHTYPNAKWLCADILDLPFKDKTFTYIVAGETIEHVEDLDKFTKEMFRLLKKGGVLAISTPFNEIRSPRVSGQHIWSFIERDMDDLFGEYGKVDTKVYKDNNFNMLVSFITKW